MFKMDLEKAEEPEIKLPTSVGSSKKQDSSRKTSTSALLTMPKPLTVWITANCGKFWKRWEYQTTLPASWEICMQVKKQQTGSRSGKEYVKAAYCHPAYLTYMQRTSCETLQSMGSQRVRHDRATELNYVLHSVSMCVIVSENLNNWFWFLWVFSPWIMNPPIVKTFMSLNHYMFEIYSCYKKWQIIVWKPVNKTWKYILENNNDSKHLGV